jgi:beta-RFAP synthase
MPPTWKATLLLPVGERRAGFDEERFFENATPLPNQEVWETISLSLLGLAASVAADDFDTFACTLNSLQRVGFKAREVAAQPDAVTGLLQALSGLSACGTAMSSMGPLLFCVTHDDETRATVNRIADSRDALVLGTFDFRNAGFNLG